jgi:uncharacterized membrane protein
MKLSEDRYQTLAAQLEQETIASRDREKKIQQLQEEVKLFTILLPSHKNNCRAQCILFYLSRLQTFYDSALI